LFIDNKYTEHLIFEGYIDWVPHDMKTFTTEYSLIREMIFEKMPYKWLTSEARLF